MDKLVLDKYKNDPAWTEIIRLYSGLFDNPEDKVNYIIDLADYSLLQAYEASLGSIKTDIQIENIIINNANDTLTKENSFLKKTEAHVCLAKINKNLTELILFFNEAKEYHGVKRLLIECFSGQNTIHLLESLRYCLESKNNMLASWLAEFIIENRNNLWLLQKEDANLYYQYFIKRKFKMYIFKVAEAIALSQNLKSPDYFIKYLLRVGNTDAIKMAKNRIDKHQLNDEYPIEKLILACIQTNSYKRAILWIKRYKVVNNEINKILINKMSKSKSPRVIKLRDNFLNNNM